VIFVTVGAQMAFDRLVMAVDAWAGEHGRGDVIAQIGPSEREPRHLRWVPFMDPPEFRRMCEEATAIVAHAGMGSIITALELGKPLLIMPRRGDLRETRNDHQIATARRFSELRHVSVAWDETELPARLDDIESGSERVRIGAYASPRLLAAVRAFIDGQAEAVGACRRA
jgi:UDP-N-acetylglucosamine transferase subunit ALG13